ECGGADELYREAGARRRHYYDRVSGEPSPEGNLLEWAELKVETGDLIGAEALAREAIDVLRSWAPPANVVLVRARLSLASVLEQQRRFAEAEPILLDCHTTSIGRADPPDLTEAALCAPLPTFYP